MRGKGRQDGATLALTDSAWLEVASRTFFQKAAPELVGLGSMAASWKSPSFPSKDRR